MHRNKFGYLKNYQVEFFNNNIHQCPVELVFYLLLKESETQISYRDTINAFIAVIKLSSQ